MSNYAKRIAALLRQIQEAEEESGLRLIVALYGERPATGKWEVQAQLQDSSGKIETQVTEFDTLEEAEAAVDRLIEKYPDTSKKKLSPAVCNVGNMDFCADQEGGRPDLSLFFSAYTPPHTHMHIHIPFYIFGQKRVVTYAIGGSYWCQHEVQNRHRPPQYVDIWPLRISQPCRRSSKKGGSWW